MPHKSMIIKGTTEDAQLSVLQRHYGGLVLEINTDAMEPTLKAGDTVLFDQMAKKIDRDGIYAFRTFEGYVLRRITIDPDTGKMVASTDNRKRSQPVSVFIKTAHAELVGRIMWLGRKL